MLIDKQFWWLMIDLLKALLFLAPIIALGALFLAWGIVHGYWWTFVVIVAACGLLGWNIGSILEKLYIWKSYN